MRVLYVPLFLALLVSVEGIGQARPKLLAIYLDGFDKDYLDLPNLQGFKQFSLHGVSADYVKHVQPLETYMTIMSGLRPSEFHEVLRKEQLYIDRGLGLHQRGDRVPFWVTATKQGVRTDVYFWPNCQYSDDIKPQQCVSASKTYPSMSDFQRSIMSSLDSFKNDDSDLSVIYMKIPRRKCPSIEKHNSELADTILELDAQMYYMTSLIETHGLLERVNVMIISDDLQLPDRDRSQYINITDMMSDVKDYITRYSVGLDAVHIWPKHGKFDKVYEAFNGAHPQLKVIRRDDTLIGLWFLRNDNTNSPVTLIPQAGWCFILSTEINSKPDDGFRAVFTRSDNHMKGTFLAKGRDFKDNALIPAVRSEDIYLLMCHVLGVEPEADNNGSWSEIRKSLHSYVQVSAYSGVIVGMVLVAIVLISFVTGLVLSTSKTGHDSANHKRLIHF